MTDWIQTVSIVILVFITGWYAWSNHKLTKLLERQWQEEKEQKQEEKQNRKRHIVSSLLSEIKDNIELTKLQVQNSSGNILYGDAWQTYKSEVDFLPENLVKDIRLFYVIVFETSNVVSSLRVAHGWEPAPMLPENMFRNVTVGSHIRNLEEIRDKNYEKIREKANKIIEQVESLHL